jgi:phosphoserine phosphatase RsbU/P
MPTHAVRRHRGGELRDDATLILVEWSGRAATLLVPELARGTVRAAE